MGSALETCPLQGESSKALGISAKNWTSPCLALAGEKSSLCCHIKMAQEPAVPHGRRMLGLGNPCVGVCTLNRQGVLPCSICSLALISMAALLWLLPALGLPGNVTGWSGKAPG